MKVRMAVDDPSVRSDGDDRAACALPERVADQNRGALAVAGSEDQEVGAARPDSDAETPTTTRGACWVEPPPSVGVFSAVEVSSLLLMPGLASIDRPPARLVARRERMQETTARPTRVERPQLQAVRRR
jgi:hypothetical protein